MSEQRWAEARRLRVCAETLQRLLTSNAIPAEILRAAGVLENPQADTADVVRELVDCNVMCVKGLINVIETLRARASIG